MVSAGVARSKTKAKNAGLTNQARKVAGKKADRRQETKRAVRNSIVNRGDSIQVRECEKQMKRSGKRNEAFERYVCIF
jgi:hypothetical protein